MLCETVLKYDNLELKNLNEKNCTQRYADWLNNKTVNQFLSAHWNKNPETILSCRNFVYEINISKHSILWGIFVDDIHIGNIKLGPIHEIYKHADVSYFIGEQSYWQKGYAVKALRLVCFYAFNVLNLNRLNAGCCELNIPSEKTLLKVGFVFEGRIRKERIIEYGGEYFDGKYYGLLRSEFYSGC